MIAGRNSWIALSKDLAVSDEVDIPEEACSVLSKRKRLLMIVPCSLILRATLSWPRLAADGQLADAPAGRGEDRVGQRRHDRGGRGLADAAGRRAAVDDVHLDLRHLVEAQHAIVAEVGLLDASVLQGDLAEERRRQAIDDAA